MALRSQAWYTGLNRSAFHSRAWMRRGLPGDAFDGRPQIAICSTWSDLSPCNRHLQEVAEYVARGVWEAGGVPLEMPVPSIGENQMRPTAMLFRNLAAMAVEEMIRANPVDGVVLLGGCDKTIPALLMGACSVDLPALVVAGGPMLTGTWRGRPLGCGTDVWRLSEEMRAGTITPDEYREAEQSMIRSRGHCNTMGTASTMACVTEALGMTLPGNAGIPAPDSRLLQLAHHAGRRIVRMVDGGPHPEPGAQPRLVPQRARHARRDRRLHQRRGAPARHRRPGRGAALARRRGRVQRRAAPGRPPARGRHLMEDFFRAGGLRAVLREIRDRLDPEAITVLGRPLVEGLETAESSTRP